MAFTVDEDTTLNFDTATEIVTLKQLDPIAQKVNTVRISLTDLKHFIEEEI